MNLIEQVLVMDGRATEGPWTIDPHSDGLDIQWEGGEYVARGDFRNAGYNTEDDCLRHAYPNAALIALYRTAAPKLARALEVAMEGMRYLSRTTNEAAPIWCSDFIDTGNGPSMRFVLDSMKCEIETILNEGEPK